MLRRIVPAAPALAVTAVILVYAFFASHGRFEFPSITWDQAFGQPGSSYYASQAEGFRRGQLSMAHRPDPKLLALARPYDFEARQRNEVPYLWDASLYDGRYYLYFSPLPALLFHLPFRGLSGRYPHDITAGLFFAIWAFLMSAALVRRALALMRRRPHVPLWIWLLMLGAGNLVPVVIVFCRIYEIAILCGAAMSATFAFVLLRFLESPTTSRLLWSSFWLALAVVARPNLALLGVVLLAAVFVRRRADWPKALALLAIPLLTIGSASATYNYARFGHPLEFGARYQLTYMDMAEHRVCSCRTPREAVRLINTAGIYVGAPLRIGGEFPFVHLTIQYLDWKLSFNHRTDGVGGLMVVMPVAVIGSILAAVVALRRPARDDGTRGGLLILAGGWLTLLGLSTCWYATARYQLDFMFLITAGAVIGIEAALTMLEEANVRVAPLRAALIASAAYSIVLGILLGFTGAENAFSWQNPELYKRLGDLFR